MHRRRVAAARLGDKGSIQKLFGEIGPAFKERPGGYTRIIKLSARRIGDNATQVLFGFVPKGEPSAKAPKT